MAERILSMFQVPRESPDEPETKAVVTKAALSQKLNHEAFTTKNAKDVKKETW
jgi:hypothetical protein